MKVAIVADWLTNMGGAERVVLELHRMFPEAPIYTSLYSPEKMPLFRGADVRTGYLQKIPLAAKKHQLFPTLRARYFQHLDLNEYDLVISSSGAEAKAVRTGPQTLHINYCHSPTHYYWVRPEEYLANPGFGALNPIFRSGLKVLLNNRRRWDYLAAQQPDVMVANSTITQERIAQFYDRPSEVVFPPVDVERFELPVSPPDRSGFIAFGRQVHYKRVDLAVMACTRLGLPLTVIGNGPEHEHLRKLAGPTVRFLTDVDDYQLVTQLHASQAAIFGGVEDFGIVYVESLAAGCPVIAYDGGGVRDIVESGKTGMLYDKQNIRSLMKALRGFDKELFSPATLAKHAEHFSRARFQREMTKVIDKSLSQYRSARLLHSQEN